MGKEEFIIKAKEMGYIEEMIKEMISNHEDAEKLGIKMDYEVELENLPISD